MSADLFKKEDIYLGNQVELIALCSKIEVFQNVSTAGSYREIYHLAGKDGAYITAIMFKSLNASRADLDTFEDQPVLVKGTIGEYRDALQIYIESISPLKGVLDRNNLLGEMVDQTLINDLNDLLYEKDSMFSLNASHLKPSKGLEEAGAGTLAIRLHDFLRTGLILHPEQTEEYIKSVSLLAHYYLSTENTLDDRINLIKQYDTPLIRALIFGYKDLPEYADFVKLHHLIMKPRGCSIEILDINYSDSFSSLRGNNKF